MTERANPRRRDAAATREALLTAARELFATRGFDRTTVRDIAAAAGVNQALLFRYFGSKEELLGAALAGRGRALLEESSAERLLADLLRQMFAEEPRAAGGSLLMLALSGPQPGAAAEILSREVSDPYARALASLTDAEDAELRAELVLAWVLGLALSRVVRPEGPLVRAEPGEAIRLVLGAVSTLLERTEVPEA
ncbi:TetR/AcrR family transcriptional regulator [Gandjariella thermophila]|uniref:TetR/AcrR family transcriptional regulator n=1 Tax=Gandjariella thermophila TaxID=1931992 RepID=UPI0010F558DE|nr:TetR/AcrR family transcriptional regulator [Gandjariella thermophila]